jgi:hypothetical protein
MVFKRHCTQADVETATILGRAVLLDIDLVELGCIRAEDVDACAIFGRVVAYTIRF